ncbi:MAG: NUDIX domain-containing protein [Ilumatobacteraceae bacterium]
MAIVLVDSVPGEAPDLADPDDAPEHGMEALAGGAAFLLSRRASRLSRHAGQWALPGGRIDEGEDVVTAALRSSTRRSRSGSTSRTCSACSTTTQRGRDS